MATLNIEYIEKEPALSWNRYLPSLPTNYNAYFSNALTGPWTKVNAEPILLLNYLDTAHPLTTEKRLFWKVTAVLQDESEVDHAGPVKMDGSISQPMVGRIIKEIQRRHKLMLEKFSGESCTVYFRKSAGEVCSCVEFESDGARLSGRDNVCSECYNTGIVGGYVKAEGILIRVRSSQEAFEMVAEGYKVVQNQEAWVGTYPYFDIGDFFVRDNGERFAVTNVKRREIQGTMTLQKLSLQQVEPQHSIHSINL